MRAFAEALGGDLGETARLLVEPTTSGPPVHLCARPGRVDAAELADEVGGHAGRVLAVRGLPAGGRARRPARRSRDGRAHVQDEGSQLVAAALAAAPGRGPRTSAGWTCAPARAARPALLGALAAQRGRRRDRGRGRRAPGPTWSSRRSRGLPVTGAAPTAATVGDDPDLPEGGFDRVLVDAPCTGLGSLRRRPESRWRRQPSDLPPLTRLQRELLGRGAAGGPARRAWWPT